jgi:Domain of unknown function (DUF4304)
MKIEKLLDSELKIAGFVRAKSFWYRDRTDTYDFVQLQKSRYGPKSYINIGICLKSKPPNELKNDDISIFGRADEVNEASDEQRSAYSFGFSREVSATTEEEHIKSALHNALTCFFSHSESFKTLKKAKANGALDSYLVRRDIYDLIS